ncbi:hypothetical protein V1506DRAFT_547520 [Lipomyces tetrasporus]
MSGRRFRPKTPPATESTVDMSKAMPIVVPLSNDGNRLYIRLLYAQYLKLQESWSKYKSEANIPEDQKY